MTMKISRPRPHWVDEEPLIQSILHRFIDQLEQNVKPLFRINRKTTPELYDDTDEDPKYLWDLVKTLDNEYHILTVKKPRSPVRGRESFENTQLLFNLDKEPQVRQWLNRPAFDPYTLTWNERFAKVWHLFEDGGAALEQPLRVEGKSAGEVLQGFATLAQEIQTPQTLRNLSAKCFWGDSKFLDAHADIVYALFPEAKHTVLPRPLMMNIALPEAFDEVIFVENLDSFLMLKQLAYKDQRFARSAFVYSAGFKGTSATVRKRGEVVFSALSLPDTRALSAFEQWWLSSDDHHQRCYFWGDMDYAGLSILAALRRSFTTLCCWQPGYSKMLAFHAAGLGHAIRDADKMMQLDPRSTGCPYADEILLPAIRQQQRFLDQEAVAARDL